MVEESFEKLKLSPAMKAANDKWDAGDIAGAIPLFLQAVEEDPRNVEARIALARLYVEKGQLDEARNMYDQALGLALADEAGGWIQPMYDELKEKGFLESLSEDTLYRLAASLDKVTRFEEAAALYDSYISRFPASKLRPKAIYREHLLWKDQLKDGARAQASLALLQKEYPGWLQALG
jgi:tetratricopeptide (TPR) repeat protein